jgi:agmatine deiminase
MGISLLCYDHIAAMRFDPDHLPSRTPFIMQTLASQGYRHPAEWEPHEATWIAWPHNKEDWPGKFGAIPWVYVEIVRHLSRVEIVRILVNDGKQREAAAEQLQRGGARMDRVEFIKARTDRVWTRDYAPSFVVTDRTDLPRVAAVDWGFNAWAKYDNHAHDGKAGRKISEWLKLPRWKPSWAGPGGETRAYLEGGSIDVNGDGLLMTTEECLLSDVQARNPGLSRDGLEQLFADYFGIRQVIWLGRGIVGDDTHGHVDDIARFVSPRTVIAAVESDKGDPNHEPLEENLERLKGVTDRQGKPLRIIMLPMPEPVIFDGQRLPASYANFYIANELVLVPTFNDPRDAEALAILARAFKTRRVIGIHAVDLVWGLGTIHCMTHEQPAGSSLESASPD